MTIRLRLAFAFLQLQNTGNWCYLNTAVLTILWSILSCRQFEVSDWGPLGHHIAQFIDQAKTTPVLLILFNVIGCPPFFPCGIQEKIRVTQWNFFHF